MAERRLRTRGAVALMRLGKTAAQIAAELECSRPLVTYWLSAERLPSPRFKLEMRERYGIAESLWDEPAAGSSSAGSKTRPAPTVEDGEPIRSPSVTGRTAIVAGGPFAMARELTAIAETQIRSLREDPTATPLERAKVMASLATTIRTLASVTGDYDLAKRMTKLPLWRKLETELEAVLRRWPDAAQAVAEVFERLDAEAS